MFEGENLVVLVILGYSRGIYPSTPGVWSLPTTSYGNVRNDKALI